MEESDIDYDQKTLVILGEEFDLQCIANESLSLEALYELASDRRDISGRRVWEGGLLLTKYLLEYGRALLNGKTVLELGAGTGVASIGAIRAGSEVVVASDGDKLCVPLLKDNLESARINESSGLAIELTWGDEVKMKELASICEEKGWRCPPFDIVLAADVLYKLDLVDPFLVSVVQCLSRTGLLLLCHIPRVGVEHSDLEAALRKRGFGINLIEFPSKHGIEACETTDMDDHDSSRARIYHIKTPLNDQHYHSPPVN